MKTDKYDHIMMAMKTTMTAEGAKYEVPQGTPEENAKLDQSYEHLCKMRDELVTLNIVPPISEWSKQSYEHLCKMRDELVTLNIVPPISEWNKINPNL